MKTVKVKKAELLEILQKNRAEHRAIFEEALRGYRTQMVDYLDQAIKQIKAGQRISHHISLVQPVDQTKEYDRAIKMCEMSVDDVIELDQRAFASFVMDDWDWMDQFLHSNASYSTAASTKMASLGK